MNRLLQVEVQIIPEERESAVGYEDSKKGEPCRFALIQLYIR